MAPTLSIIIPVYNVEQYIGECLRSIFCERVEEGTYEVIIVNDGTPDKSMDVVRDICSDKGVKVVNQNNQGLSAARMTGLSHATGQYVWFFDSDDWLLQGGLSRVLSFVRAHPDEDVFAYPLLWTMGNGDSHQDYSLKEEIEKPGLLVLKNRLVPVWATPRFIIRRQLFENKDLHFPVGLLHEDDYFGRVLLYLSRNVYICTEPVYAYRQREGSITAVSGVRSAEHILRIHELLISFCQSNVAPEDMEWFERDVLRLIRAGFTRNEKIYKSKEFRDFQRNHLRYILGEYKKFGSSLSVYEWISDLSLYLFPVWHTRIYYLAASLTHGK